MSIPTIEQLLTTPTTEQIQFIRNSVVEAQGIGTTGDLATLVELAYEIGLPGIISPMNVSHWPAYENSLLNTKKIVNVGQVLHDRGVTVPLPELGIFDAIFPLVLQMSGSKALVELCALTMINQFEELSRTIMESGKKPIILEGGLNYHLLVFSLMRAYEISGILLHPYPVADTGMTQTPPQFVSHDIAEFLGPSYFQLLHQILAKMSAILVNPQTLQEVWKAIPDSRKNDSAFKARFFSADGDPAKDPNVLARIYLNQSELQIRPQDMKNGLYELPSFQPVFEEAPEEIQQIIREQQALQKRVILFTLGAMQMPQSPQEIHHILQLVASTWNQKNDTKIFFVYVNPNLPKESSILRSEDVIHVHPMSYGLLGMDAAIIHGGTGTTNIMNSLEIPVAGLWNLPEQKRNIKMGIKKKFIADIKPARKFNEKQVTHLVERLIPLMISTNKSNNQNMAMDQSPRRDIAIQALYHILSQQA